MVATDPFKDDTTTGRPFLLINHTNMPFHSEQYIVLSLTTRTWHDERIPLSDEDWVEGGAPKSSSIMPWSVNSVKSEWINYWQGTLHDKIVDRAITQLQQYIE
ncbi:type II toxin-antitoxin system PemK/MazF family toxin [Halomicrococcus sp. NG-SE-24]|uniref:type II toxin-antitoxin system PemK/MazF family toxin n=1 Tax=Halomicrococcus sp. NG-SE-24 TaxID=3436928 RepID=UPI003D984313